MKVLARRANGLLFVTPIVFGISFIFLSMAVVYLFKLDCPEWFKEISTDYYEYGNRWYVSYSRLERYATEDIFYSVFLMVVCLVCFFDRLFVPKIIIEYDNTGLYIYHNKKDVTILRYDYLAGENIEVDLNEVSYWVRYRGMVKVTNFSGGLIKTGSIRFECPGGFVTVRGVANVKEVGREIDRMVRANRDEYERKLEESMYKQIQQREAEELLKHNPDT